jgi:BirA family transcriptional regulator, biotin operon repressor / biotin---[acetyl-CoA-carboxylase] ligase
VTSAPDVPPGYIARPCAADPFTTAIAAAERGAEDGTLFWQAGDERCAAALVLRPLDPLQAALTLAYVGQLGLIDGFAALAPPSTDAALVWPDRLLVNGACAGGIRLAHGPLADKEGLADVPDWVVLGFTVQRLGEAGDEAPGRDLEYTNLFEEGCAAITPEALIASFSRFFMQWLDRWQEQGFPSIRPRYAERLRDRTVAVDDTGDAWTAGGGEKIRRPLREALRQPSWTLPHAGSVA